MTSGVDVVVPIISPLNSPTGPHRNERFWKMTTDYQKLNQVVAVSTDAGPDVASLLEKTNTAPIHGMHPWLW